MKKTLLALAVISAASSVNAAEVFKSDEGSVDFYGQLRPVLLFTESSDHEAELNTSSSRMGVNGVYVVNDGLKILGEVEVGVALGDNYSAGADSSERDDDTVFVRRHIFGFDMGDYGVVRIGKEGTWADDIYFADYSYFFGGFAGETGYGHKWNNDSQIKYAYTADNFWVKAGYAFGEKDSNEEIREVFAGTTFGDLAVHAGVMSTANKISETNTDTDTLSFEVTGEYALGEHTIGLSYYHASEDDNIDNATVDSDYIALSAMFAVADKTTLYGGYEYLMQDSDAAGTVDADASVAYVGVEYKFSKWARVFAEAGYTFEGTELDNTDTDDASNFGLGARFYW